MSTKSLDQDDYFSESVATFGDRLEAAREAKGLTAAGLAEKLGVKEKTVLKWENDGDAPRANRIQMLAGLLNVSIVWLISGESNGTSHVEDSYDRPTGLNDALGELSMLKTALSTAIERIERLEERLKQVS